MDASGGTALRRVAMALGRGARRAAPRLLQEIERDLLGWSRPPASRAIEALGWSPEPVQASCWRCGSGVGQGGWHPGGCARCRTGNQPVVGDRILRLGPYVPPLRDWILAIKYGGWESIAASLGASLGERVRLHGGCEPARLVVTAVPAHWLRRLDRGSDHAASLALAIASHLDAPILPLLRRRAGPPQAGRSGSERRRDGGRGMSLRSLTRGLGGTRRCRWVHDSLAGAHILLVDDVRTTAATLARAVRLLRRTGADRVVVGVLAAADPPTLRQLDRTSTNRP